MTLALYERGLFTWPEWAAALAVRVKSSPAAEGEDAGDAYYRQWLEALEDMVAARGAATGAELERYRHATGPRRRPYAARPADLAGGIGLRGSLGPDAARLLAHHVERAGQPAITGLHPAQVAQRILQARCSRWRSAVARSRSSEVTRWLVPTSGRRRSSSPPPSPCARCFRLPTRAARSSRIW
ncbi:nitrile hydratase accessory protein [Ramlibacter terrae]|uniref:Nitrile hydratase accessory protein n=1 Tax=Ramlibacter terrae TaxID=2732511 RepID=A0ABX6P6G7_9BURK|nr:nitrile hydratase accessory protein [Ramlibacter terrae]